MWHLKRGSYRSTSICTFKISSHFVPWESEESHGNLIRAVAVPLRETVSHTFHLNWFQMLWNPNITVEFVSNAFTSKHKIWICFKCFEIKTLRLNRFQMLWNQNITVELVSNSFKSKQNICICFKCFEVNGSQCTLNHLFLFSLVFVAWNQWPIIHAMFINKLYQIVYYL